MSICIHCGCLIISDRDRCQDCGNWKMVPANDNLVVTEQPKEFRKGEMIGGIFCKS